MTDTGFFMSNSFQKQRFGRRIPKSKKILRSRHLFPFFSGLLPEGKNKSDICRSLRLDSRNKFDMLLELAQKETIGDITVQEV